VGHSKRRAHVWYVRVPWRCLWWAPGVKRVAPGGAPAIAKPGDFCGRLAALSDTAAPHAGSNSRSTTAQVECSAGWVALAVGSLWSIRGAWHGLSAALSAGSSHCQGDSGGCRRTLSGVWGGSPSGGSSKTRDVHRGVPMTGAAGVRDRSRTRGRPCRARCRARGFPDGSPIGILAIHSSCD